MATRKDVFGGYVNDVQAHSQVCEALGPDDNPAIGSSIFRRNRIPNNNDDNNDSTVPIYG